jgi:hypothetical protein
MISRRNFVILAAPAIIRPGSLMRIRTPQFPLAFSPQRIAEQIIGVQDMTAARGAFVELYQMLWKAEAIAMGVPAHKLEPSKMMLRSMPRLVKIGMSMQKKCDAAYFGKPIE